MFFFGSALFSLNSFHMLSLSCDIQVHLSPRGFDGLGPDRPESVAQHGLTDLTLVETDIQPHPHGIPQMPNMVWGWVCSWVMPCRGRRPGQVFF
jgi:hypothetical protein